VDLTFHARPYLSREHLLNLTTLLLCLACYSGRLHSHLPLSPPLVETWELHAAKTCLRTSITILCAVGFNLRESACTLMEITKTDYLITLSAVESKADFDFWVVGSNSPSWVHCCFPLPSFSVSYLLKMKGFEQEWARVISTYASVLQSVLYNKYWWGSWW